MQAKHDDLWTRDALRHPSVPAPSNLDARLWRYMSGQNFRWLVDNRRLYMPRLEQLAHNDPREGTMPDAQAAWWQEMIKTADGPEAARQLVDSYKRYSGFVDMLRRDWFVSCWTLDDTENFAFWQIYGRENTACKDCGRLIHTPGISVAIATTFRKLEDLLPAHIEVGRVGYSDYKTAGADRWNLIDHVMNKRHFYKYEAEVRAVANIALQGAPDQRLALEHIESNLVDGAYAPEVNVNALIDDVVVHPEASTDFVKDIKDLCSRNALPEPRLSGLAP